MNDLLVNGYIVCRSAFLAIQLQPFILTKRGTFQILMFGTETVEFAIL